MTNFGSFEMFPVSQNIYNNIVEPLITTLMGPGYKQIQKNSDNQRSSNYVRIKQAFK